MFGITAGFYNLKPGGLSGFAKCQGLTDDELSTFFGQAQSAEAE